MWYYIPGLFRTKALVLELLAAVCLVRDGHDIILAAFDNLKEVKGFTNLSHTIADFTLPICTVSSHFSLLIRVFSGPRLFSSK
jgi:hypothetical protein